MGLREKVALATVAVIAAQIVSSHCMPRSLPHCSVKSHISSLISPKTDSIREFKTNRKLKKNSYNNILNGNSSKVLNLPNVKEPSDFEAGGYYRFYCDYPHEPKKLSETQFQTRNFKREAKQKRYLDLGPRDKGPLPITSSGLASEPPPQPYCFRKSSFFPEVEYPLSARDMWIPKYWSRLLDAEVPRNVKIDTPIYQNVQKNTKSIYPSYEKSPLHDIIKTLNNHNKVDTDKSDQSNLGEFIPKTSEDKSKHDSIYPYQNPNTPTTAPSDYTAPDIHSGVLPYTKTTIDAYPVPETASASSASRPTVTSATPMVTNIPATIASVTSSNLRNSDFDTIGATTTLPFDDFTSPITQSIASADNFTLLPTTVTSMQTQEREASLSETNIEPTATPELVFFISSTEKKPEQQSIHTTPIHSITISPMKSSDVTHPDFDEIGVSTASPSDLFTSSVTQSIASADNFIALPTTVTSVQAQEQEASLSQTNIEPTVTPELVSYISSTEKKSGQQLRDHTTPIQSTTLSPMKSLNMMHSDFDEIGVSTASPSYLITSPVTQSIASADNIISLPTTIASVQTQERETSLSDTIAESSANPKLLSLISSTEKIPEQQLRDHTTPIQSTTLSPMKSSNMIHSDFDEIGVSTASPSYFMTSPVTQSISSADNFISLPTTIESVQTQERETSLSETIAESSANPKLLSLISSTEKIPEQQLRDQTTPMQSTTLSPMKSSDMVHFDKTGVSTASPSDLFTSPVTQSLASSDNFISFPTTFAAVQTQERETSLSETNTEPSTTPKLQSLISSTEKIPERKLRDQTTPVQSTTLSPMKSSDMIHFDETGVSTASPSDLFTSPVTTPVQSLTLPLTKSLDMLHTNFDKINVSTASPSDVFTTSLTHLETLADSFMSHTQTEKIPTTLSTVTSTRDEEGEKRFSETDTKPTTTSPLLSLGPTVGNKTEEKIMDYTTPMRSTPIFKIYSDDKASSTDLISFFSNSSDLVPSSNVTLENINIVNDNLDTNESLLKHNVVKNDVDVKQPSIPSSSIGTISDHSHSVNLSFPEKPNQLDTFQGQVVGYYYENLTNDDILQLCTSPRNNSSIIFTDDYKDNWVYSPNDSYITWESIPECSDECFIFIDTENPASSTVICNDNNLNVPSKPELTVITESKYSGDVRKNVTSIPDSPDRHTETIEKNKSEEMPKIDLDNIPKLNLHNLTEVKSVRNPQENRTIKYSADNALRVLDNIGTIADSVSVADNAHRTILTSPLLSENVNDSISNIINDIGTTTTNELEGIVNYIMQESNIDENIVSAGNYTINDLIVFVDDMNSTSETMYVDLDDTWASYTEIPYDSLVLYPEDENETWTANGNEYALYQQMSSEDSDDTTQFFLDTEKLSGLRNDIILNTN